MGTARETRSPVWTAELVIVLIVPALAMLAWMNFAPVLPLVKVEFGIDNTSASMLTAATLLAHMAMQLPAGRITDTLGTKRTIVLAMAIVGVAIFAAGLAPSFGVLLGCRFLLGVGTGMSFISGRTLAIALFPAEKRTLIQGIYTATANGGFLISMLASERLAFLVNWRGVMLIEGAIVLVFVLVAARGIALRPARATAAPGRWQDTFRQPSLYFMGFSLISTYGAMIALMSWAPTFMFQRYGIGLEWAGPMAAFMTVSSIVGCGLGAYVSLGREKPMIIVSGFATALGVIVLPFLPSAALAVVALLWVGWFAQSSSGALYSYPSRVSNRGTSGLDLSLISVMGNVGSFSFPIVIGRALDLTGVFTVGFGVVGVVCLVCSVAATVWLMRTRRVVPAAMGKA